MMRGAQQTGITAGINKAHDDWGTTNRRDIAAGIHKAHDELGHNRQEYQSARDGGERATIKQGEANKKGEEKAATATVTSTGAPGRRVNACWKP